MRRMKRVTLIIFSIIFSLFCVGCKSWKGYEGDYPELFSVAVNSLWGTEGFIKSEIQHQPVLELIETDVQGRKLFCYSEAFNRGAVSLLISQISNEQYVYYYPDYNFISDSREESNNIRIYGSKRPSKIDNLKNNFSIEDINQLKAKNS